ncbi:MAG: hypothetical protein ACP5N7_03340 [Candidatus Pacearchaeota archaeon]
MSKLPQHIEKRFDKEFYDSNLNCVTLHDTDPNDIKSFIATILEEEREKISKTIRDEVIKYVQEAVKDPESDNYTYAESIPLNRLDKIINLIKEDEKNNL